MTVRSARSAASSTAAISSSRRYSAASTTITGGWSLSAAWATASRVAGGLWLAGLSALLFAGAFWLDALLRLGRQAAQDAGSPQG